MANLSDISVVNIFKGIILDSLTRDGFIRKPPQSQSLESFFSKNKSLLFTSAAVAAGAALGPVAIGGAVTALGFGQAGITAGSIAAWMMSLHRGAVAAGSLVAILQSIGAAGLSIGGIIAAGVGGGFFAGAIAKSLQNILESNPEGLAELENFVSVTCENDSTGLRTKVIFDLKHQLLVSGENEKLKSFFKGFHLAQQIAKTRARQFEFKVISDDEKCIEGSNFLHYNLIDTYGINRVTSKYRSYLLTYMLNNALFKATIAMVLRSTTFISLMTSRSSFIVTLK